MVNKFRCHNFFRKFTVLEVDFFRKTGIFSVCS